MKNEEEVFDTTSIMTADVDMEHEEEIIDTSNVSDGEADEAQNSVEPDDRPVTYNDFVSKCPPYVSLDTRIIVDFITLLVNTEDIFVLDLKLCLGNLFSDMSIKQIEEYQLAMTHLFYVTKRTNRFCFDTFFYDTAILPRHSMKGHNLVRLRNIFKLQCNCVRRFHMPFKPYKRYMRFRDRILPQIQEAWSEYCALHPDHVPCHENEKELLEALMASIVFKSTHKKVHFVAGSHPQAKKIIFLFNSIVAKINDHTKGLNVSVLKASKRDPHLRPFSEQAEEFSME